MFVVKVNVYRILRLLPNFPNCNDRI